jgi:hypothetical protein
MGRILVLLLLVAGCSPDPDLGFVPLSRLTLEDMETNEPVVFCGATEYPALIGTYEVSNTVPADTGHWQFYVGEVVVQPVTAMFDIRIRGSQDPFVRLQPGESATIEIWALVDPAPGRLVEFHIGKHYVPAADADADARLATTWTTELGTDLVAFLWDCG